MTLQSLRPCYCSAVSCNYSGKTRDLFPPQAPLGSRCYGCATAVVGHSITVLKALCTKAQIRSAIFSEQLMEELVASCLGGQNQEGGALLVSLTRDDMVATRALNACVTGRVERVLRLSQRDTAKDVAVLVQHEMALLAASAATRDKCWEERIRCVAGLFMKAGGNNALPLVMEHVCLPCLKILKEAIGVFISLVCYCEERIVTGGHYKGINIV